MVTLRFFNVFGPRQRLDSTYAAVVPAFIDAALQGRRPVVHGDGLQSRDFTYVDNVVDAVRRALVHPANDGATVYNVACGERLSVIELWTMIAAELGCSTPPDFEPARLADMRHTQADIAAARAALGYEPTVSVADGIARTIAWARSQQGVVSA